MKTCHKCNRTLPEDRFYWERSKRKAPCKDCLRVRRQELLSSPELSSRVTPIPLATRFWLKVDKSAGQGPGGECWTWKAARNNKDYGVIRIRGKNKLAHRIAYELEVAALSDDECVLHQCDNPPCVNPGHLRKGTLADNAQDMVAKGRQFTPWRKAQTATAH